MGMIEGTKGIKEWRGVYSVATDGGTAGTKAMRSDDSAIPNGSVILGGYVNVIAAPGSAGAATVAVQAEAANDIIAATAFDGAPWSTTGRKSVIPVFTGATTVKTTAARIPAVVIAVATITLASIEVVLFYR